MESSLISNFNPLSNLGFEFFVDRLPNTRFFINSVTLPGLSLGTAEMHTPFVSIPFAGDLVFNEFTVSFLLDEELEAWNDIFDWLIGLGFPSSFGEYKELISDQQNPKFSSDAVLTILDNKRNPKFKFTFEDLFPISLSPITLTTNSNDVEYQVCEVVFDYKLYKFSKIK